jgi:HD superfamily phosphodiesterase
MINKVIADMVEDACKKETNHFGYGIWKYHIVNVVRFSKELAVRTGADIEVVEIAALLHDYASIKDFSKYEDHHIYGALEAETLLKTLGYPDDKIQHVKTCIYCHRGSVLIEKPTKESICVSDADAMSHFAAIPSLYYLAFTKYGMGVDEANAWLSAKLERSWQKLSPEAKDIVRDQYEAFKKLSGRSGQ